MKSRLSGPDSFIFDLLNALDVVASAPDLLDPRAARDEPRMTATHASHAIHASPLFLQIADASLAASPPAPRMPIFYGSAIGLYAHAISMKQDFAPTCSRFSRSVSPGLRIFFFRMTPPSKLVTFSRRDPFSA